MREVEGRRGRGIWGQGEDKEEGGGMLGLFSGLFP
jgi:hypothetical protein